MLTQHCPSQLSLSLTTGSNLPPLKHKMLMSYCSIYFPQHCLYRRCVSGHLMFRLT